MKNVFLSLNFVITVALIAYLAYDRQSSKKGYILNQTVFEAYKGTKELQDRLTIVQEANKTRLDSLWNVVQSTKDNSGVEAMYHDLLKSSQLQEQELSARYTSDIWHHINEGISVFGRENGYDFIFGASGDGGLMYADDANDITSEVVGFLNARYGQALNE